MRSSRALVAATMIIGLFGVAFNGCGRIPASLNKPSQEEPLDDPDLDPDPGENPGWNQPDLPSRPNMPAPAGPEPWPSPVPERQWPPLVWKPLPNYTPIPSSNIPMPTPTPGSTLPVPPQPNPTPVPSAKPTPVPPPPPSDPPAGWQPSTAEEFYLTLRKFGYDRSREEAFARVRRYVGIERDVWSPSSAKQLDAKWRKARTYMDPAPITLAYYDAQARAFARRPNAYYVRTDYSFRQGSDLIVIKADPLTRESLAFNLKGEMTYYTQLRAMQGVRGIFYRHAILVPPEVYRTR